MRGNFSAAGFLRFTGSLQQVQNLDWFQLPEAFHDVLRDLSRWGLAHARDRLTEDDLNPDLLMWRMRRRVDISALPRHRVVVRFEFPVFREAERHCASCG